MLIKVPKGWEIPEREVTPEWAYQNRRELIKAAGLATVGLALPAQTKKGAQPAAKTAVVTPSPAKSSWKNPTDLKTTPEWASTTYNNYYELHPTSKEEPSKRTGKFIVSPWKVEIKGLVNKPMVLDLDALKKEFPSEERIYRFRCVERWAMVVPWNGFTLAQLIKKVDPKPEAKFVRFISVNRPDQLPGMKEAPFYPWPYHEGLRMDEAMNDMTLLVTGMYGKDLPKQNGAPIRIIAPWKYGYKSPKSIVTIEFTEKEPKTLWNDVASNEYGFYSNVNPDKPHPRWSQSLEELIPDGTRQRTKLYNGYEEFVGGMYNGKEY